MKKAKCIYVDGCFGPNSEAIGRMARANGIKTLLNLDIPSVRNIGLFDTVIANEVASKLISPEPFEAARKIHEMNGSLAIVTLGEKGCVCCDGRLIEVPAFKVETVDTTGAGAAFAAAFIYARLAGMPLKACLEFAGAAGAFKTLHRGSYRIFSKNEIMDFIQGKIDSYEFFRG